MSSEKDFFFFFFRLYHYLQICITIEPVIRVFDQVRHKLDGRGREQATPVLKFRIKEEEGMYDLCSKKGG